MKKTKPAIKSKAQLQLQRQTIRELDKPLDQVLGGVYPAGSGGICTGTGD